MQIYVFTGMPASIWPHERKIREKKKKEYVTVTKIEPIVVEVHSLRFNRGLKIKLNMFSSDNVKKLKKTYASLIGFDKVQAAMKIDMLVFAGGDYILSEDELIGERRSFGISQYWSNIHYERKEGEVEQWTADNILSFSIKLSFITTMTIKRLKQEIEKYIMFTEKHQQLVYEATNLEEDDKTLADYNIRSGAYLHMRIINFFRQ